MQMEQNRYKIRTSDNSSDVIKTVKPATLTNSRPHTSRLSREDTDVTAHVANGSVHVKSFQSGHRRSHSDSSSCFYSSRVLQLAVSNTVASRVAPECIALQLLSDPAPPRWLAPTHDRESREMCAILHCPYPPSSSHHCENQNHRAKCCCPPPKHCATPVWHTCACECPPNQV